MTTVFVTGSTGYIAKHCVQQLLNEGYTVRASLRDLSRADEVRHAVRPGLREGVDLDQALSFVELDLTKDEGWVEALAGSDVLMHTASPFPIARPKHEDDLVRPAVDGTLRALRAAQAAGIRRVVLTSSTAAIMGHAAPDGVTVMDETYWTDVDLPSTDPYSKSKTLAERAAWDFVTNEAPEMALTTINPVLVVGAPLDEHFGSSVSLVERLVKRQDPMLPDLEMAVVDVADVARMHVSALASDEAKGQRFIASAGTMSFVEMATTLRDAFPQRKFVTRQAPNFLVWILGIFDSTIRAARPMLGQRMLVTSKKAQTTFDLQFVTPQQSLIATATFLFDHAPSKK
ncbi:MAG: aldehyde reductase [Actinomycetota bacterium]|jgi:dihydroflavonol-4-reductase